MTLPPVPSVHLHILPTCDKIVPRYYIIARNSTGRDINNSYAIMTYMFSDYRIICTPYNIYDRTTALRCPPRKN